MSKRALEASIVGIAVLSGAMFAQEMVSNWPAPELWSYPVRVMASEKQSAVGTEAVDAVDAVPTAPLHFVGITPCRVADTRGNGFTGQYGVPALTPAGRNMVITAQCGIPGDAQAVSFNFSAVNVAAAGFLVAYPAGGAFPPVATMTYNQNTPNLSNAAVVPLGTGGAITVVAAVTTIDLVVDVNGYYRPGVVTSVTAGTGLSGGGTGAVTVGIAAGGVTGTELGTGAVTSGKIGANAVTAGAIASGQVVKDVNGLHDSVTLVGSGGTTVTPGAGTITISSANGGGAPSGSFVLGYPGDSTLIGAGFTETGFKQDFWKATTTTGAPTPRFGHTAVWTGTKMIVWGGFLSNTGGLYDPVTDSWTPTTTSGAPPGRSNHTAVWTGTRMIVWGGEAAGSVPLNTGGRYDPVGNAWAATTTTGASAARYVHTAVWTGSRMVVWGGNPGQLNTGGRYDPVGDTWTATTTTGAPAGRTFHTAVWTGSRMIVWGGFNQLNTGGRYDPVGDTWTATTTTDAPSARNRHTAVWTGSRMIVFGGIDDFSTILNNGGQYDPGADSWTPTATSFARQEHTAVWTGSKMILWGGRDPVGNSLGIGSQYDPVSDSFGLTATLNAPAGRYLHSAVWTGTRMIVWGGWNGTTYFDSGGQYHILSLYLKN